MSIITEARNRADNALEQSKFSLTSVQDRITSLTGDARGRASEAAADTKGLARAVVGRARRQIYVQIGVNDAIVASVARRGSELPGDAQQVVVNMTGAAKQRVSQANERAAQVQDRLRSVVGGLVQRGGDAVEALREIKLADATAGAKGGIENRVYKTKDAVDKLASRGEQVVVDLRHDPVVARLIGGADTGVEKAANQLTSIAQKLRARAAAQAERENATVTATPVRPVPAKKVPAHAAIARKTPVGEAAISATPTHRAAAYEAKIRHEAAVKAAETRKDKAEAREQAAEARKAIARRAARTRKVNAEQATAKRTAAALKAAETRKANAQVREQAAAARKTAARKAVRVRKENSPA